MSSYKSENMLKLHKLKSGDDNITAVKTSSESHLHWKKNFHKIPSFFRIFDVFEADDEIDEFSMGNNTTNIYISKIQCLTDIV